MGRLVGDLAPGFVPILLLWTLAVQFPLFGLVMLLFSLRVKGGWILLAGMGVIGALVVFSVTEGPAVNGSVALWGVPGAFLLGTGVIALSYHRLCALEVG